MLWWSVCGKNHVKNITSNEWMGVVGIKSILKWTFDEVYPIFRISLESFRSFRGLKAEIRIIQWRQIVDFLFSNYSFFFFCMVLATASVKNSIQKNVSSISSIYLPDFLLSIIFILPPSHQVMFYVRSQIRCHIWKRACNIRNSYWHSQPTSQIPLCS